MKPEIKLVERKQYTCPRCKYSWIPRFEKPKVCPRCKLYFDEDDGSLRLRKLELEEAEGSTSASSSSPTATPRREQPD